MDPQKERLNRLLEMEDKKMKKNILTEKNALWKKAAVLSLSVLMGASMMACGAKGGSSATEKNTTVAASETAKETEKAEEKKTDGEELKGKISEIKDFMFTVTTEDGKSYALSFDKKPEGLSEVKDGDEVVVHYTGELSEADAFTGEVLSVEKA